MCRHLYKAIGVMKNQGNMTPSKEYSEFPVTSPKEMEIQEFPDKEFKIIVLMILKHCKRIQISNLNIPGKQHKNKCEVQQIQKPKKEPNKFQN